MKRQFIAIALVAFGILFFGCQQQQTQYVCSDGSTVLDKNLCPTPVPAQPTATESPTAAPTEPIPVSESQFDKEFWIELGKTVKVNDLEITFLEMMEDSRCPENTQCIWAGQIVAKFNLAKGGKSLGEFKQSNLRNLRHFETKNVSGYYLLLFDVQYNSSQTFAKISITKTPPTQTPAPQELLEAKCFSDSDCYFSGSICASRLNPQATDGKAKCENCACNCVSQKCAQTLRATPTPSPSPTPVPEKIGVAFVQAINIKYNYAEVQWHTGLNTTSHLRYGNAPGVFRMFYDDKIRAIDHWVPLGQLDLNRTYYFEVKSCILKDDGTEGECETAPLSSFKTLAAP